jgi:hypothetical protein
MAFDPDAYLQQKKGAGAFDPDAYLATKGVKTPQSGNTIVNQVSDAVKQTPLGMAARGVNDFGQGIGKILDVTGVPVSPMIQKGASALFRGSRAAGVGVANKLAQYRTPMEVTQRTVAAARNDFQPQNEVEAIGAFVGENAPVMATGALFPMTAGPIAMMAQQAQSGKVSPLPLAFPIAKGAGMEAEKFQLRRKVVPPLLKASKGIPVEASKMAIDDPSVLDLKGTSQSIQERSQAITDGIKDAGRTVGDEFNAAYAEKGMRSPVEKIINEPTRGRKNFEQLKSEYHSAIEGDLFKKRNLGGGSEEMSNLEKLETLTDLKRGLQDQAIYPPAGQQLAPSEGAHNAAIQRMAAEIDATRGKIAGGDRLALADDAWSEMQEIRQRLTSEFADPYKGQDYLNRLLKQNTDWLTSGRNAGKMGAIERVEQITGKELLKPALRELAAAYLNNPDALSLPSWNLRSIISVLVPTKSLFKKSNVGAATGRTVSILSKKEPEGVVQFPPKAQAKPLFKKAVGSDFSEGRTPLEVIRPTQPNRVLDESGAREYLKKANGDKNLARKLAKEDGWRIP